MVFVYCSLSVVRRCACCVVLVWAVLIAVRCLLYVVSYGLRFLCCVLVFVHARCWCLLFVLVWCYLFLVVRFLVLFFDGLFSECCFWCVLVFLCFV